MLALVCDTLLSVLRDQVDGSLAALDPDAPLTRYGMDSLATVEAAVRLEKITGRKVPPALLAQTPTAREVARLLAGEPLHNPTASNGDIGRIPEIAAPCQRHGAMLMVDGAHSVGVLGRTGRGVSEPASLGAAASVFESGAPANVV